MHDIYINAVWKRKAYIIAMNAKPFLLVDLENLQKRGRDQDRI